MCKVLSSTSESIILYTSESMILYASENIILYTSENIILYTSQCDISQTIVTQQRFIYQEIERRTTLSERSITSELVVYACDNSM